MLYENINLNIGKAALTVYKPDGPKYNEAILVIPGGGYGTICRDREGEPIALAYAARGFTAFVLEYSVGGDAADGQPIIEASYAMSYIRENAVKYEINPNSVYAVGFSAGGHLAASLAVLWHRDDIIRRSGIKRGSNRPNAAALCYPVITAFEKAHKPSFYNIIGSSSPTNAQLEYYSIEKHVDKLSSPAFIMHTANDKLVPVENSLYLAQSYACAGVPFELHVYPDAPHGLALANELTSCGNPDFIRPQAARWLDDSIAFFRSLPRPEAL